MAGEGIDPGASRRSALQTIRAASALSGGADAACSRAHTLTAVIHSIGRGACPVLIVARVGDVLVGMMTEGISSLADDSACSERSALVTTGSHCRALVGLKRFGAPATVPTKLLRQAQTRLATTGITPAHARLKRCAERGSHGCLPRLRRATRRRSEVV